MQSHVQSEMHMVDKEFSQAVELMHQHQYAQASQVFEQIIRQQPSKALAHCNLGICQMCLGAWEKAEQSLQRYLDYWPHDGRAYARLGMVEHRLGRPAGAIDVLNKAVQMDRRNFPAWEELGETYWELRQHEQAREAFRQALHLRPRCAAAWKGLGEIEHALGDDAKAVRHLLKAIALSPATERSALYLVIARIYRWAGELSQARLAYQRVLSLSPGDQEALFEMGLLYVQTGKYELAAQKLQILRQASPKLAGRLERQLRLVPSPNGSVGART